MEAASTNNDVFWGIPRQNKTMARIFFHQAERSGSEWHHFVMCKSGTLLFRLFALC